MLSKLKSVYKTLKFNTHLVRQCQEVDVGDTEMESPQLCQLKDPARKVAYPRASAEMHVQIQALQLREVTQSLQPAYQQTRPAACL